MDPELIGVWVIRDVDMIEDTVVSTLAGLPGEHVEFTADGRYVVDLKQKNPCDYLCRTLQSNEGHPAFDTWIENMDGVTESIYQIEGNALTICTAGDEKKRPTKLIRNDKKRWCMMVLERAEHPKRKYRRGKTGVTLKRGSLIPAEFKMKKKKKKK